MSKVLLKRPISEEIENKKARINLLESDKKAYSESVNDALQDCKKRVHELRKENNKLRKQVFDKLKSDEHVINQAFQRNLMDKSMLVKKTSDAALGIMDGKVSDKAKQLNLLKHLTQTKKEILEKLLIQYDDMNAEAAYFIDTITGVSKEGQQMRNLENRLDKATLKCNEAQEISKVYHHIKDKLQEEYLHYGINLDALENEIEVCNKDLCHVRVLYQDAISARDLALKELKDKEDEVLVDRKRRDKELSFMRKAAETKSVFVDKMEKRTENRDSNLNLKSEDDSHSLLGFTDIYQQKIVKFEECYRQLQDVSGVLNIQEAVLRHKNQNNTEMHLTNMIDELETQCFKLNNEYKRLLGNLTSIKFENETKNSDNVEKRNETENYIKMKEDYQIVLKNNLNKSRSVLALCKLSFDHLEDILPAESSSIIENRPRTVSDPIIDHFVRCQGKIDTLMYQLTVGQMDSDSQLTYPSILETSSEFQTFILKNIPPNNTRIAIKKSMKDHYINEDNNESGEDDNVVPTRSSLKREAYLFVESKVKKKNSKKKKKTKDK